MKYYYRFPRTEAMYSQDAPCYIMVGRWAHIYNWKYGVWLVVDPPPEDLNRDATELVRIKAKDFFQSTPNPRNWLEYFEDIFGIRLKYIARRLRRWRVFKNRKFLFFLETIDDRQDFTEWQTYCQPPKWGVGPDETTHA